MKPVLIALLASAFMLPTAASHAFNSRGNTPFHNFIGPPSVTGHVLIGQCKRGSRKEQECSTRRDRMKKLALKGFQDRLLDYHQRCEKKYSKDKLNRSTRTRQQIRTEVSICAQKGWGRSVRIYDHAKKDINDEYAKCMSSC